MAGVRTGPAREQLVDAELDLTPGAGLRMRPRRPARALVGGFVVAVSIVSALAIYTRIGDRRDVLAVTRTVLAGEQLTVADLKVVSIASDDDFPAVSASNRGLAVGQYARVRMIAGSLVVAESLQPEPLVDPGKVLMSVTVPLGGVPTGLREGSRLVLVVTPAGSGAGELPAVLVEAVVAAVPGNLGQLIGSDSSGAAKVALSVEVAPDRVALVGSAAQVAVGVLDPQAPFPAVPAEAGDGG
jgi:hypothetical protein